MVGRACEVVPAAAAVVIVDDGDFVLVGKIGDRAAYRRVDGIVVTKALTGAVVVEQNARSVNAAARAAAAVDTDDRGDNRASDARIFHRSLQL